MTETRRKYGVPGKSEKMSFFATLRFFLKNPELNFRRLRRGQFRGTLRLLEELAFSYGEKDREIYSSQYGQDKFVAEYLFPEKNRGIFVDVGANDGVTLSNSLFFEKQRSWTGLCVEPLPEIFEKLREAREKAFCENVCVSQREGTLDFAMVEGGDMLSGIVETMDKRHHRRIEKEKGHVAILRLPSLRLQTLLEKYNLDHVDFLSIDTEGSELEVLHSLDFEKTKVGVICVENNSGKRDVRRYLEERGFVYYVTLGDLDDLYVFSPLFPDLAL
ncbi:MAG TPA: FkbM family methyltransferase [Synergistaceae bacterium]|nr:FkbM family methyltransferase [Synergistaceae bacterium]HPQ37650.1 FkbM family methyltransferase [Synergistaceae bacterium]